MSRLIATFIVFGLMGAPVFAQQMPDAAQMAGTPLGAPELADGTISVRLVRERMGNNVVNHPVRLVAAQRDWTATTDEQGRARFEGIEPGTVVYAEATVDGEGLQSQEFDVPVRGGVRVALVAGAAEAAAREQAVREAAAQEPPRQGIVVFGGESRVILEFQDDTLQVFYLLDIVNAARTPIDVGEPLVLELPRGVSGASLLEGTREGVATVQGNRVVIDGPFAPGTTHVQLGFRMPYRGDTLTLEQRWPAVMEQLFVAVQKVGALHMTSPQFTAHQDAQAGGQPFIMATGGRLNAGDVLTLDLTGLPHRSTLLRDAGVAVGILVLAVGLWAGITGAPARRGQVAALEHRREKLLADLVELEKKRRAGRVDPHRYADRRRALIGELERVMGELDRAPAGGGEGLAA